MKKKENKTMKKVLTVSALALLLGLVGYTGGSTFAKYISQTKVPSTSATVAKWGYVVNSDASKLWGDDYKFDTDASVVTEETSGLTVADSADDSVVAPGTKGEVSLNVKGQPEVLSKIDVTSTIADIYLDDDADAENGRYYPVKWSISGTATINDVDQLPADKTDLTGAEMAELLANLSATNIPANVKVNYELKISWSWAFNGVADAGVLDLFTTDAADKLTGDEADTVLGNDGKHYNDADVAPSPAYQLNKETSFTLNVVVSQLDKEETSSDAKFDYVD